MTDLRTRTEIQADMEQEATTIDEMAAELRDLAPDASQHEALLRARWGEDFDAAAFRAACLEIDSERKAAE